MASSTTDSSTARSLGPVVAITLWAALGTLAVVLLWRRLAGAFTDELPLPAAWLVLLSTLALSMAAYAAFLTASFPRQPVPLPPGPSDRGWGAHLLRAIQQPRGIAALPAALCPLVLAAALFPPNSTAVLSFAAVLIIVGAAMFLIFRTVQTAPATILDWSPRFQRPARATDRLPVASDAHRTAAGLAALDSTRCGRPVQQFSRYVLSGGGERVDAVLEAAFSAGQSQTAIHIPFAPPLCAPPTATCRVLGDSSVRARVTAAKPYGARIEVKRDRNACGPACVKVVIEASAAPSTPTT